MPTMNAKKKLLTERLQYFKNEVDPSKIVSLLTCLTTEDQQEIECHQNNHGAIRALSLLVDRLRRRTKGFDQFVVALRELKLDHVAQLLDPFESVEESDAMNARDTDDGKFRIVGTAVDVEVNGQITCSSNQGNERNMEFEKLIAREYESAVNENSCNIRKTIKMQMPQGIVFVRTKLSEQLDLRKNEEMTQEDQEEREERKEEDSNKEQTRSETTSSDTCSDEKLTSDTCSDEKLTSGRCSDEKLTSDTCSDEELTSGRCSDEKLTSDTCSDEKLTSDTCSDEKLTSDTGSDENLTSDTCSDEELTSGTYSDENLTSDTCSDEKLTSDTCSDEKLTSDTCSDEKLTSDTCSDEKLTSDTCSDEKLTSDTCSDEELTNWDNSFKVVFRLTSEKVAKEFWEMYTKQELEAMLTEILIRKPLKQMNRLDEDGLLKFNLKIFEKEFEKIMEFFKNIESEQDVERTGESLLIRRGGNETWELDEIDIRIPEVLLESHKSNAQKRNLKLREYQKELAHPAIQGMNTIICAPTNSGKTFVAMEIAKTHLEKHKDSNDVDIGAVNFPGKASPKVIFIVSTQNLVLQQRTRFEEYLTNYSISDISGSNSTEIPLEFLLKTHDVIVLTAQILLNALQKNTVKISQISLLLFDECHHTNKDHNYNKIMQNYMAMKYQPTQDFKLPQIVGLTASLGVGKSSESEKAKNHILQICANMDACCISTVKENEDELAQNVTGGVPRRKLEKVDQIANVFEKVIIQVMAKIETAAQKLSQSSNVPPADRIGQQYRQWVEGLENDAIGRAPMRDLVTYAKHLRRYHVALLINDTVRIKDAMKYLEEFFEYLDKEKFQYADEKLQELYEKARDGIQSRIDNAEPNNPKLEKLKELILKFHEEDKTKDKTGETKGILFTRTRDSTMGLKGWIHETQQLTAILRPKILVGAGDGEVGMTQGEQEAIIEEFKKGEVNILIATTVAEEGLDIGDCNFVIRYNMAGNEISSVQSRGRIRADDGNYVYVGDSRTKGVNRERLNQYREILMHMAVAEVQQVPQQHYMHKITDIQQNDVRKIQMKNSIKKVKPKQHADDVRFYCRRCNTMACHLDHFRTMKDNYRVILDKEFKNKIQVKPKIKPKKVDDVLMDSQVHCIECGEEWGVSVKIDGLTLPCLKIRSFAIEQKGQPRMKTYKKWSDFPFEVPEATHSEIVAMDDTLDSDDLNLDV